MGPAPSGKFRSSSGTGGRSEGHRGSAAQRIRDGHRMPDRCWGSACFPGAAGRHRHYPAVGVPGSQADG
eukprot:13969421-Heterocapsa_arctica.AAC.1